LYTMQGAIQVLCVFTGSGRVEFNFSIRDFKQSSNFNHN